MEYGTEFMATIQKFDTDVRYYIKPLKSTQTLRQNFSINLIKEVFSINAPLKLRLRGDMKIENAVSKLKIRSA